MTDPKQDVCSVLNISPAKAGPIETTVTSLADSSDQTERELWNACYRLACGGFGETEIRGNIHDIVYVADTTDTNVKIVASGVAATVNGYTLDSSAAKRLLADTKTVVEHQPVTTHDVFATLERAAPVATCNDYTVADVFRFLISEASNASETPIAKHVTETINDRGSRS